MSEQKQQPIISIDHVSMRFNLAKEKHESLKEYFVALLHGGVRFDEFFALSDVSFDIMPGDFYGLIGLNGSGKSTLLKVISGVYKPSAGKVTVNGTIAPLIELGAGFDMDLTARENIYLNGTVLGYTPKYIDSKFDDIVEFSELQEFLDVPLKNYSSGMVARLAFAVATMTKPDILIADEILSVGDFLFQEKCEKRMAELLSGGTTVILVSHSIEQIERMCNKVAWLILSTMYVFVRDIMHIWEVFCTLLVYGSAIFYDPSQMASWMQAVINLNPIYWYITAVRSCVMWGTGLTLNMVLIPFLCSALSLGIGVYVFKKNQDKFVLYM